MVMLSFIFGVFITIISLSIVSHCKDNTPKNKVHFYVARDIDGDLWLYLGKPERQRYSFINSYEACGTLMVNERHFKHFGLNPDDFQNLKWEDWPVEVFLNLED